MPDIQLLDKPVIRLIGTVTTSTGTIRVFNKNIDNSVDTYSSTGIDANSLPNFQGEVRIIITGQVNPKATYIRENGLLPALTFEGDNITGTTVGQYAETFYSLNKKSPVRDSNYLYNHKDWDDVDVNPSTVDVNKSTTRDIDSMGFLLKCPPTGASNVTLKAKTYYRGNESTVAIVYFKISLPLLSNKINNEDNNE